jgi:hypothetical protein
MKRRFLCLFVCFLTGITLFAIEFTVAPLYLVDEAAERVDPRNNFDDRLLVELGKAETGLQLRFKQISSPRLYNPPQSVGDAIAICRAEHAEYLIYGFITRKDQTIQGELRLLDYAKREVIVAFFSMDSRDREDELIQDLAAKVFRYVKEQYNIEITVEPPAFTHIQFPVSFGYWQPVNRSWRDLIFGIVRLDGGIQLIPTDNLFVASGYVHYLSVGLDLSYRIGRGHYYPAWDHGFTASLPILFYRKLNEQHEAYIGFGLMYALDVLGIQKPYEDSRAEIYSAGGVLLSGGWQFRFREALFFFVDARLEIRFYDTPMVGFTPSVGVVFRRFTQEVVKKWQ